MNTKQLQYFQTIMQVGSFQRASAILGVAEPTISNGIKSLEQKLGVTLFDRQKRQVQPTAAAQAYYYYVNQALTAFENGQRQVQAIPRATAIKVGFFYSLGAYFLPALMREFWRQYPDDQVTFSQKNSLALHADLERQACDVVLCAFPQNKHPRMAYVPILEQEFVVAVGQANPLAQRHRVSIDEFGEQPLITFPAASDVRNYIDNILLRHQVTPRRILEFEEDRTILGFVAQNLGYAILPRTEVTDFPGITQLQLTEALPPQYIYLGFRNDQVDTVGLHHFITFTKQYCLTHYQQLNRRV